MEAKWFAGRLRELREAKGLGREQLAERAGIKPSGVRDLEQSVYSPNWETVVALCRALGVTADAFLQEPAERPPAGPGRPRKAAQPDATSSAPKRNRSAKRPAVPGPVASTPATEQQAVPPSGGQNAGELPAAQYKPKARRARKPRG